MPDERRVLVHLFEHNVWANDEMLAACVSLTDAQLTTEFAGTYGRLDQILIHLARAQGGYARRVTGWEPGPEHRLEYEEPFPGVDRIASHLRHTGGLLVDAAATIDEHRTVTLDPDDEWASRVIPAWVVLLQAAYHATEHRQQVATALGVLGNEPPEPDLWNYWDAIDPATRTR